MTTQTKQAMTGQVVDKNQNKLEVGQSGFFGRLKWATMRGVLSTAGRSSQGVRTGYQHGFDSGTMLDYVYVNKAHGTFGVGKLIDRVYLNAVGWRAIRARRDLLKSMLSAEVEHNRALGQPTRLLDVAAGPGRYLQELLQECGPQQGDLRILCRDLAPAGVEQGRRQAEANRLQAIHYEQGDAFNPAPTDAALGGAPNVIVVSGLYELLLEDETIQKSLERLYELLAPGGAIYFTTQTNHPQLEFIANVLPNRDGLPWVMKCRAVGQLESWAKQAGFKKIESRGEKVGLFTVTTGRK